MVQNVYSCRLNRKRGGCWDGYEVTWGALGNKITQFCDFLKKKPTKKTKAFSKRGGAACWSQNFSRWDCDGKFTYLATILDHQPGEGNKKPEGSSSLLTRLAHPLSLGAFQCLKYSKNTTFRLFPVRLGWDGPTLEAQWVHEGKQNPTDGVFTQLLRE